MTAAVYAFSHAEGESSFEVRYVHHTYGGMHCRHSHVHPCKYCMGELRTVELARELARDAGQQRSQPLTARQCMLG